MNRIIFNYLILSLLASLVLLSCNNEKTIHPQRKNITEAVYASGFLMPENEYKVYALSDGYIVNKYLDAGNPIRNGQAIYKIQDDASLSKNDAASQAYRVALSNASANSPVLADLNYKIKNAEAKFQHDSLLFVRNKNLFNANAASQNQLEQASLVYEVSGNDLQSARQTLKRMKDQLQVELKNAQSNLSASGIDLNNYFVKSMMDGIVYDTYKELGEAVRRSEMVALVGEKNKILRLSVDQQDIDKIKTGQTVLVKMDLTGNNVFNAHVSKIYPAMNQSDQTFKVEAQFADPVNFQFVHSSVEANIIISKKENALVIPLNALRGEDKVELKGLGNNNLTAIKKGIQNLEEVEVLSGIDEKSELVISNK